MSSDFIKLTSANPIRRRGKDIAIMPWDVKLVSDEGEYRAILLVGERCIHVTETVDEILAARAVAAKER